MGKPLCLFREKEIKSVLRHGNGFIERGIHWYARDFQINR